MSANLIPILWGSTLQTLYMVAMSSLIGTLISQQYQGTILPLAAGFAVVSGISLMMVLIAEKGRLFSTHSPAANPH